MIELMVLGFLADGPLHGYELRRKMVALHGHARTISEGSVYPALQRMIVAGLLEAETQPGARGASRRLVRLTDTGRERMLALLRGAAGHEVSDQSRWLVILAFLSQLPSDEERRAVLRRRLEFLEGAAGFFLAGDEPVRSSEIDDPYRRGILTIARATRRAEIAWLKETLA